MRKRKISHNSFNRIFANRTFTIRDKIGRNIYLVHNDDGYFVEEHLSLTLKVVSTILMPVFIIGVFIYKGICGVAEVSGDMKYIYKRSPVRVDCFYKNTSQGDALINLAKWN